MFILLPTMQKMHHSILITFCLMQSFIQSIFFCLPKKTSAKAKLMLTYSKLRLLFSAWKIGKLKSCRRSWTQQLRRPDRALSDAMSLQRLRLSISGCRTHNVMLAWSWTWPSLQNCCDETHSFVPPSPKILASCGEWFASSLGFRGRRFKSCRSDQ